MNVRLISRTQPEPDTGIPSSEELIPYIARVSNPDNQHNHKTGQKLVNYLVKNKHWSPLEMVDVTFEIKTSRAIGRQLIMHRSFSFSERSQRYISADDFESVELRKQATNNRQSSTEAIDAYDNLVSQTIGGIIKTYNELIDNGVARECARMILP